MFMHEIVVCLCNHTHDEGFITRVESSLFKKSVIFAMVYQFLEFNYALNELKNTFIIRSTLKL